jgi:hypothetical protein
LHPEQMDIKKINIVRQILKYANYFFLSNVWIKKLYFKFS